MQIRRLDHVGINFTDLEAAKSFFLDLGMTLKGQTTMEGDLVDKVVGMKGVKSEFAMVQTSDGQTLELIKFLSPETKAGGEKLPANALGIRHLCFAVDDLDAILAKMKLELIGEVQNYKDIYKLCYVRGPEDIIIELAEELS